PRLHTSGLAVVAGLLLAAPQVLPTLVALGDAAPGVTGHAGGPGRFLPGAFGLVMTYVSHSPAPAFALAALPLALTNGRVRALLLTLVLCLTLRWGRGPLSSPGALALVFDLTLALLAGLSLGAQWEERRTLLGRRLRTWTLAAGFAGALALSVAAAALGPLRQELAAAVGVLALGFILYAATASARAELRAGAFLLPMTLALLLQPAGRDAWAGAATRRELAFGTPVHEAVDRALGPLRGERMLTLARSWPRTAALDLGFGNLPAVMGRASANGYNPLVPRRTRDSLLGLNEAGVLPGAFFRSSPFLLERLGIRLVQAPTEGLTVPADSDGLGEVLDLPLEAGRPRLLPVPRTFATSVRLATWMADAVTVPQGQPVASATVRLASGRELTFPIRAGIETGEWALDRSDVGALARHRRPRVQSSFREPGQDFDGHRYFAALDLGGRYLVEGLRLQRVPDTAGRLYLHRAGVGDGARTTGLSLVSAYLSDVAVLREIPAVPRVRLYAVRGASGLARVVDQVRVVAGRAEVREVLRHDGGFDPRREAILDASEAARSSLGGPIPGARARRAEVKRLEGRRISLQAEGPGLVVLSVTWDPGWTARVDGKEAPLVRVGEAQIGLPIGPGPHRIGLRHDPRGFQSGLFLFGLASLGLTLALAASWRGGGRS
ncbi:MAG TPA: YfhO family protein, partial [Vicinamibacteria bacterium]